MLVWLDAGEAKSKPGLRMSSRDEFSPRTRRAVALRAGYLCSFRGCQQPTAGPSQESPVAVTVTGRAAHIHGAAPGPGSRRYLASMSPEERSDISNAIWLCTYHADLIDQDEVLFVILHNRNKLYDLVRYGDAIGDDARDEVDAEFDSVVEGHRIQTFPRPVTVELASLDGAIVLENSGKILSYGAILQPKKTGRLSGSEGSRTKAAIGASKYGLAVKISADGGIVVYHNGDEFISI